MDHPLERRQFLRLGAALLAGLSLPAPLLAEAPRHGRRRGRLAHPEPRKGYTAEKVLKAEALGDDEELIELFNGIREIPHLVDGIRCQCGCAENEDMYSLLSCYEGDHAMAKWCPICQGEGRMTVRLAKQGKTLEQIRKAIDVRY